MTRNKTSLLIAFFIVGTVLLFQLYASGLFQYDDAALLRGEIVFKTDLKRLVVVGLLVSFIAMLLAAAIAYKQRNRMLLGIISFCCGMFIDVLLRWVPSQPG